MPRLASAAIVLVVLAGCVGYTKRVPIVQPAGSTADPPPARPSAKARQVRLKAIVMDLPVGHEYGEHAWGWGGGCTQKERLVNTTGRFELETRNYADVFRQVMARRGYPVDDDLELFGNSKDRVADLQLAARVVDAALNECFPKLDRDKLKVRGNAYLKVEWSLYSTIEKKVVFVATTEGGTNAEIESSVGEQGLLRAALGDALERLARRADYLQVVERAHDVAPAAREGRLKIKRARPFSTELKTHIEAIKRSVATVTANRGSGSGFVISEDGSVVTAEHVISGSRYVKVTTTAGKECYGEVAAASKQRDLALIRLDCPGLTPLPLVATKVVEGSEVFAIGTPLTDELQFSVTKGVVSGVRRVDDLDYIQSDVRILPGNSGGPLLDGSGNAVGIATSQITARSVPVGVSFFVPVADIEKYLPVDLE